MPYAGRRSFAPVAGSEFEKAGVSQRVKPSPSEGKLPTVTTATAYEKGQILLSSSYFLTKHHDYSIVPNVQVQFSLS